MKQRARRVIDIFMTIALMLLMGYQFWGETAHEWFGAAMFILYFLHHILNRNWYKTLFKGRMSAVRVFSLITDTALFLIMLMQIYSSIVISRHVFAFLPINGGMAFARKLHILSAYWGFILMGFHIGQHISVILSVIRKKRNIKAVSNIRCTALNICTAAASMYGIYALIKRDFLQYMFLKSEFVFLDYAEPKLYFYLDVIAIAVLCMFSAHWILKVVKSRKTK
ncbi:DUF4405 domain-containing protein [Ructibacterium gallinarum]|uniref:DUF4405 domain-containing protein n=1 Tax=Ructibacterium gallinarum TaxID=2779355 RepID=A0A9D5LWL9_9FIRM|nr:DUF4405 domain-containing protein [Ructibacterium gallinarum]MBE5039063.1 DUF4405 domain-containing protein [Ructibacterium gallinarum]